MAQQPAPPIGADVTTLMPPVGSDVSALMAASEPPPPPPQGYWEDRGIAGATWHPPGGAPDLSQRPDTAIITGLPVIGRLNPEDVLGGYGAVRAIGGAVAGRAATTTRAVAALRASLAQATPVAKYEVTKTVLQSLGVPTPIAVIVATGVSGYERGRGGGAAPPAAATPHAPSARRPTVPGLGTAPPPAPAVATPADLPTSTGRWRDDPAAQPWTQTAAPPFTPMSPSAAAPPALAPGGAPRASAPAVPAPPIAPTALRSAPTPPAGPQWSPQRLRNEVGLAARRAQLKLSDEQYQKAEDLVRAGAAPEAAVVAVAPPPKVKIVAAEMGAYTALRRKGLSHQEAVDLVAAQRDLVARLGTPTSEAVRHAVAERNVSGRWPAGTPEK